VLPKEIVGAIANETGIAGKHIGQIDLFDDYSTVELPDNLPDALMDRLARIRIRQVALGTRKLSFGEAAEQAPKRRVAAQFDKRPPAAGKPPRKPAGKFDTMPPRKPAGKFDAKPLRKAVTDKPPRKTRER